MTSDLPQPVEIKALQAMAGECGARIGLPAVRTFTRPQGDGSPYVEVGSEYHFIVEERGIELKRLTTSNADELLYWLFDGITFSMAADFEVRTRKPNEDSRRQLFARQEELLGLIASSWRARKVEDHRHILAKYPFNDDLG